MRRLISLERSALLKIFFCRGTHPFCGSSRLLRVPTCTWGPRRRSRSEGTRLPDNRHIRVYDFSPHAICLAFFFCCSFSTAFAVAGSHRSLCFRFPRPATVLAIAERFTVLAYLNVRVFIETWLILIIPAAVGSSFGW